MAKQPKILAFAGSTRSGSFNRKLVNVAGKAAEEAGADVTYLDLRDYDLPMYCEDYEMDNGIPEKALELKKLFRETDGFLLSMPEYNSSYPAVFKNVIDWVSRRAEEDEPRLSGFMGKYAGIMATSPGPIGGMRVLVHLRALLEAIHVTVIPNQAAVGNAIKIFNDDNTLNDEKLQARVAGISKDLTKTLFKFSIRFK